jgi:ketosteroid isomerase-like protein
MPISSPSNCHAEFVTLFNDRNADAIAACYEPGAAFVPEPGAPAVHGIDAIRPIIGGFIEQKLTLDLATRSVVESGDLALISGEWTLTGTDSSGAPVSLAGITAEVLRRQPDGSWLYVLDNPFAA